MKRIVSILLLSTMLMSTVMFSACGNQTDKPSDNSEDTAYSSGDISVGTSATEAETELTPDLPDEDYEGYTFTFLNGNTANWMTTFVVTSEAENGEAVNDAIYKRNRKTEEAFNVTIAEISSSDILSDSRKYIQAGDTSFDVVLSNKVVELIVENLTIDFSELSYVNIEAPWWLTKSMTDLSIGGKIFTGLSMFDTTHYDSTRPVMFNKQLIQSYSLESPYELVNNNKWTLDKFHEMGLAVAKDLDGDGEWTGKDQYGLTTYTGMFACTVPAGVGAMLTLPKNEDDIPYFGLNTPYYIERLTKVTELYNSGEGFNNPEGNPGNNGGVDVFKEGRALFYIEGFGNVQKLRQMDMDFGILPAPKYNEAQEDFVSHGGYPYFTMIPKTNTELDRTGILLESLAYESMQTVKPAFYEINLKGKISRDNDSEAMLDIIFSTLKYDMQIAVAQIHTGVADNYIGTGKTDFASYFTGIEANVQTQIDKLLGSYNNK